jgi:hypothetical protein
MTREQLEALGEGIATFAARIDVAEHALITRLRTFDEHEAWYAQGCISCPHWLSWRTGIGLTTAREKVRVARALASLPKIDALFGRGELSYSKVRALTRAATPETEQEFIDIALHSTAAQLEKLVRAHQRCLDLADSPEPPRSQRRFVRRSETVGGMIRLEMQLPPEEAAIVWEAMLAASATDVVDHHESRETEADASAEASVTDSPPTVDLARKSSAEALQNPEELEQRRADAIVDVARAYLHHRPRTLGSGYELVVITSQEQLQRAPGGVGGFLRDGTPVPLHIARMLACDSARIDIVIGEHGELLDVGRSTRTIPSAIARALWLRDGGCRAPGCGRKRHLHAHHIEEWADGGPTKLANLVLVCPAHHRMIHEGVLRTEIRDCDGKGTIEFIDRWGRVLPTAPAAATNGRELEALEEFLATMKLHIDPSTNEPKWDGSPLDLGVALDWLFTAKQEHAELCVGPDRRAA